MLNVHLCVPVDALLLRILSDKTKPIGRVLSLYYSINLARFK